MQDKKKLIYIDDEEYNLLLFQISFSDKYEIIISASASEAIEIIKKEKIKVVITDYKMPEMTGIELINRIKSFEPEPICLILSAFLENEVVADKTKVFKFLQKPYKQSEMLKFIEDAYML